MSGSELCDKGFISQSGASLPFNDPVLVHGGNQEQPRELQPNRSLENVGAVT